MTDNDEELLRRVQETKEAYQRAIIEDEYREGFWRRHGVPMFVGFYIAAATLLRHVESEPLWGTLWAIMLGLSFWSILYDHTRSRVRRAKALGRELGSLEARR